MPRGGKKQGAGPQRKTRSAIAKVPASDPPVPISEALPSPRSQGKYVPTMEEQQALTRVLATRKERLPHVAVKKADDGSVTLQLQHQDPAVGASKIAVALGAGDVRLADHLLREIAVTTANGAVINEKNIDYALSIVEGIKPKDAIETLLATQMAGVHMAAMKSLRYLRDSQTLEAQEAAGNMANKMMRTFAVQVEALKKHRSSGEQIIKVQHVTVNGGQAVVSNGNVQGGRATSEIERQPHEPNRQTAGGTPLLGHVEAHSPAVPGASSERLERVSLPRSRRRSTSRSGKRRLAPRQTH